LPAIKALTDLSKNSHTDDMIIYISDPNNSTREFIQLTNNVIKVTGYKMNSNKSLAFLCTNDKWVKKENRETTLFTIVTNNI
jgi:HD superfamily phosphohydrolase YqeK